MRQGNNLTRELLYSFSIDTPFMTIHADVWQPGKTLLFYNYGALIIAMDHFNGFVAIEPLKAMNSTVFAKAIYTIQLQ